MANQIMSQRDRTELRRILRARFEILEQQLYVRERELKEKIAEEIRSRYASEIKEANKALGKLAEKAANLEAEGVILKEKLLEKGIGCRGYTNGLLSISIVGELEPKGLQEEVNKAYIQLATEAGLYKFDLRLSQLELEEQLAIGALGSEEAKSFLEKIPSLDKILPINGNVTAAIEAAQTGKVEDDSSNLSDYR